MEYKHEIKSETFTGYITIEVMKYQDRLRFLKKMNFIATNGEVEAKVDNLDLMASVIDHANEFVKEVNVERFDGLKLTTWEEVLFMCEDACNQICTIMLGGVKLSKN